MSWFDNQNNVIILILIAVILYFMMNKNENFRESCINVLENTTTICDDNHTCRYNRTPYAKCIRKNIRYR